MNARWLATLGLTLVLPLLGGCLPLAATGVATGVMMAEDRRTAGTQIDDQVVESRSAGNIFAKYGDRAHVNVTSFNKVVLLTGEAPDAAARADIENMVRSTPNVRLVQNDLVVGSPSSIGLRTKDTFVTSKVKTRLIEDKQLSANHIKVVTEAGIVYLMGMVYRKEAEVATQIARTTSDVVKVVRVFEYLD